MSKKENKQKKIRIKNMGYVRSVNANNEAFLDYYERAEKIATSIFKWKNLPDSMDGEYLELCLFWYGQASFVNDPDKGHINTKCATSSYLNIYGLPVQLNCYSYGFQAIKNVYTGVEVGTEYDQCIHVLNNRLIIPTSRSIERYCEKLANADMTADINVNAQKTPVMILCNENQRLTMENLFNQIASNRPVIFGDKDTMSLDSVKSLKLEAPFVAKEIMEYKKEVWNEMLTFLGINNILVDKKERLISDEANSNNELININLQNSLATRLKACELYNKKYNLKGDKAITVELNSDLKNVLKEALSTVRELKPEIEEVTSNE